jgi:hypothetical protein
VTESEHSASGNDSSEEVSRKHDLTEVASQAMHAVITPKRQQFLKNEAKAFLAILIYLWAGFSFLYTARCLVLIQQGVNVFHQAYITAAVEAIALAKVVLIAQKLRVMSMFEHRSLVFSVFWKSALMTAIVAAAEHLEERFIPQPIGHPIHPLLFLFAHTTATMLLFLVLFAVRELDRSLPPGELRRLFLEGREDASHRLRVEKY